MTLSLILWILFGTSFIGISFIIVKKVPVLIMLSDELLDYRETFPEFLRRKKSELPFKIGKVKIDFLTGFNKKLIKSKILSLKIHNVMHAWTETLNKKVHHSKMRQEEQAKERIDKEVIE